MSDLDLLGIEMDLLWGPADAPDLVVACAREGTRPRIHTSLPRASAQSISTELESAPADAGFNAVPPFVERLRLNLEDALGTAVALAPGSGPSFLVEQDGTYASTAQVVRSDASDTSALQDANPGNWEVDEWRDLLANRIGPWAMAVVDGRVASICHTPCANAHAAEAGTWTHPDFRGQGLAAACTAEWASLMRPTGRWLFYSTSHTNRSSQQVAARLGLRHLGCLWQLRREAGHSNRS